MSMTRRGLIQVVMPPRLIHHHCAGQCLTRWAGIERRFGWRGRLLHRQDRCAPAVLRTVKIALRQHHVMRSADHSRVTVAVLPALDAFQFNPERQHPGTNAELPRSRASVRPTKRCISPFQALIQRTPFAPNFNMAQRLHREQVRPRAVQLRIISRRGSGSERRLVVGSSRSAWLFAPRSERPEVRSRIAADSVLAVHHPRGSTCQEALNLGAVAGVCGLAHTASMAAFMPAVLGAGCVHQVDDFRMVLARLQQLVERLLRPGRVAPT